MAKSFYYFNPTTLSFEKAEFTFKDLAKRALWLVATALSFALVFVWLSFYVIDSPKERKLQKENNELKQKLAVGASGGHKKIPRSYSRFGN